jgi:hypothetical protein
MEGASGGGGKWLSSMRGLPGVVRRWRVASTGPAAPTWVTTMSSPSSRTHTTSPRSCQGTEYTHHSCWTVGWSAPTVRVSPKARV